MPSKEILELILNSIDYAQDESYAAIIGSNASTTARSPKIWNMMYDHLGRRTRMLPLDVMPCNLNQLIDSLSQDPNFLGGSVAFPFKERVFNRLGVLNVEPSIKNIGAVNCIYRISRGGLMGTNTDCRAAMEVLSDLVDHRRMKNTMVLGYGGVGKAVVAALSMMSPKTSAIYVALRKMNDVAIDDYKESNVKFIEWNMRHDLLDKLDLIVNCTSLGNVDNRCSMPLDIERLREIPKQAVYFDVIHTPTETLLLQNLKKQLPLVENGIRMSRLQAEIGFRCVNHID